MLVSSFSARESREKSSSWKSRLSALKPRSATIPREEAHAPKKDISEMEKAVSEKLHVVGSAISKILDLPSYADRLVEMATNANLAAPNSILNRQISDLVQTGQCSWTEVLHAIKKRLKVKQLHVRMLVIALLEMVFDKCTALIGSSSVNEEVEHDMGKILKDLLKMVGNKKAPVEVQTKILDLIQTWGGHHDLAGFSIIVKTYNKLKEEGVQFPEKKTEEEVSRIPKRAAIFTPGVMTWLMQETARHKLLREEQARLSALQTIDVDGESDGEGDSDKDDDDDSDSDPLSSSTAELGEEELEAGRGAEGREGEERLTTGEKRRASAILTPGVLRWLVQDAAKRTGSASEKMDEELAWETASDNEAVAAEAAEAAALFAGYVPGDEVVSRAPTTVEIRGDIEEERVQHNVSSPSFGGSGSFVGEAEERERKEGDLNDQVWARVEKELREDEMQVKMEGRNSEDRKLAESSREEEDLREHEIMKEIELEDREKELKAKLEEQVREEDREKKEAGEREEEGKERAEGLMEVEKKNGEAEDREKKLIAKLEEEVREEERKKQAEERENEGRKSVEKLREEEKTGNEVEYRKEEESACRKKEIAEENRRAQEEEMEGLRKEGAQLRGDENAGEEERADMEGELSKKYLKDHTMIGDRTFAETESRVTRGASEKAEEGFREDVGTLNYLNLCMCRLFSLQFYDNTHQNLGKY